MASLTLFIIFLLASTSAAVRDLTTPLTEKDDENRPAFQALPLHLNAETKEFYFHVYFHEIFYGPGQTTETVISHNAEYPKFADVLFYDVPLWDSLDEKSVIARAQGSAMQPSQKTYGWLLINYDIVFELEQLKGSTLQVMGQSLQLSNTREWSIVGGTGVLTMAKGIVYGRTVRSADDNSLLIELKVHGYYTPMQQPPWN